MTGGDSGVGGIGSLEGFAAILSGSGVLGQTLDQKQQKVVAQQ
jgi:hypothetical protein